MISSSDCVATLDNFHVASNVTNLSSWVCMQNSIRIKEPHRIIELKIHCPIAVHNLKYQMVLYYPMVPKCCWCPSIMLKWENGGKTNEPNVGGGGLHSYQEFLLQKFHFNVFAFSIVVMVIFNLNFFCNWNVFFSFSSCFILSGGGGEKSGKG